MMMIKKIKKQFHTISSLDDSSLSSLEDDKDTLCEPLNLLDLSTQSEENSKDSSLVAKAPKASRSSYSLHSLLILDTLLQVNVP